MRRRGEAPAGCVGDLDRVVVARAAARDRVGLEWWLQSEREAGREGPRRRELASRRGGRRSARLGPIRVSRGTSGRASIDAAGGDRAFDRAIDRAIDRARERLLAERRADGTWDFPGDVGPVITAQVIVALRFAGALPAEVESEAQAELVASQRPDGGFDAYPGAPEGDLGTTATAFAALRGAAGAAGEAAARARAWLDAQGGDAAIVGAFGEGDVGPLFAAIGGVIDAGRLRRAPALALGSRAFRTWLEGHVSVFFVNLACEARLVLGRLVDGPCARRGAGDRAAEAYVEAFYADFQNADGSVNELPMQTAMLVATLRALGRPLDDDRVARAVAWLRGSEARTGPGRRSFSRFSSEVWATMHAAHALLRSGLAPSDPRVAPALGWLVDARCSEPQVARLNPGPRRPRSGGWAFQRANVRLPDTDDTAVVLALLGDALTAAGELPEAERARVEAAHAEGLHWLRGMQNPDGGFAAFTRGHPSKPPGHGPTGPARVELGELDHLRRVLRALGDPSTEGLTGRVLVALGRAGARVGEPAIDRAVVFLRRQQAANGGYWGRWFVNYLPTTAWVLAGLAAVDAPMDAPWVRRAVDFILRHQRADGGFGEDARSYSDLRAAGAADVSMAGLTAIVVQGLCAAGLRDHPATRGAIRFLVDAQRSDGTWDDGGWLAPFLPPRMFYRYPGATLYAPLDALARFREGGGRRRELTRAPRALYRFVDVFRVEAPPAAIFEALSPEDPAAWRPAGEVSRFEVVHPGDARGIGRKGRIALDTPLGVRFDLSFEITERAPPWRVVSRYEGALRGEGSWFLVAEGASTRLTFHEVVTPGFGWMRVLTPALRGLFDRNHERAIERVVALVAAKVGARWERLR